MLSLLTSPFRAFIGWAERMRRGERMYLVTGLLSGIVALNVLFATNPGGAFSRLSGALAVGAGMVVLTVFVLMAFYAEYRRRFATRPKRTVDIICLDCDLVGGRTALCPGCPYNPLTKEEQKGFDLLETV